MARTRTTTNQAATSSDAATTEPTDLEVIMPDTDTEPTTDAALTDADVTTEPTTDDDTATDTEPTWTAYRGLDDASLSAFYGAASVTDKAAIRRDVDAALKTAIMAGDMGAAQDAMRRQGLCVATKAARTAPVIDWQALANERAVTIATALAAALGGRFHGLPDGVTIDGDAVMAHLADMFGTSERDDDGNLTGLGHLSWDLVEVGPNGNTSDTAPMVTLKAGKGSGPRRSIVDHVAEWAANQAVGTFGTCATIAGFRSTVYGSDSPSQGAIAAHLFPVDAGNEPVAYGKSDLTGVVPSDATPNRARGAVVIARTDDDTDDDTSTD